MDSELDFCRESPWQATLPSLGRNLATKWQKSVNISAGSCQQVPKKLTTEAIFVSCVIFLFLILSVIGSTINAFDSCCKTFLKKKAPPKSKNQNKDRIGEIHDGRKISAIESSNTSVWRENCRKLFDCFCIQNNARKILLDVPNAEHMDFIDGMRAICFIIVYIVHFLLLYGGSIKNLDQQTQEYLQMPVLIFIVIASYTNDAFILISAFLIGYSFSNYFKKNNGKVNWVIFYAFRLIRLTPVYMVLLGFYMTLFNYMSSSPIWPTYDTNPVCKEKWTWNLFYINNFDSLDNQCLAPTWFLGCLMQLYFISPLFLILLNRTPRMGYILTGITICFSCLLSFTISNKNDLFATIPFNCKDIDEYHTRLGKYVDELHLNTFVRLPPHVMGILLGYYLHNRKLNKKNNGFTLSIGWISSIILLYICFFAFCDRERSAWESAIFNGVKFLLFSCGFSWIVFACATKQGAFIGRFLSHPIFRPISRISFCAFLVHNIVLEGYFLSVEVFVDESITTQGVLSDLSAVPIVIGLLIWSLVSAFVVSVVFESPIARLLTVYSTSNKKRL